MQLATVIEKITPQQSEKLLEISRQTFFDAFAHLNSAANMATYAAKAFTLKQIQSELDNPNSEFYFALADGEVAGYLKINFSSAQTDLHDEDSLEVERIYVLQAYQGRQIGNKLLNFAINIAVNKKLSAVWLGVWEHNTKAIRFYEGIGFKPFSTHSFYLGDDRQTDILMRKAL